MTTDDSTTPHATTVLRPFFQYYPGEPVPEKKLMTAAEQMHCIEAVEAVIGMGRVLLYY